jgi:hypothetical protein
MRAYATVLLGFGLAGLTGCGTPGAPQPPSLKLPERVADLTAVRAGNVVTLHWTMPKKTTDHLLIQGEVRVAVCRRAAVESCQPAGEVSVASGTDAEFHESLPAALATGQPRALTYFVELKSPRGRSAGLSNPAVVAAGAAPGPVTGLTAEVRADGVALHWNADSAAPATAVRLHRKLLTPPPPASEPQSGLGKPDAEPVLRDLLVETPPTGHNPDGALDTDARFGEAYEYTAQRVVRISADSAPGTKSAATPLELAGEISTPARIVVVHSFPPSVPQGLVAVFVAEEKTIDLSWLPDSDSYTDKNLAGYIVYRGEPDQNGQIGSWKRISGPQPLVGPAFRDTAVQSGHSYRYAVTAIDLTGRESNRSAEAAESVPEAGSNP